jgi:hypothetical protein
MAEATSGSQVKWSDREDGEGYIYAMHRVGQLNIRWERGTYRGYVNGSMLKASWAKLSDAKREVEAAADRLPSF